MAKTKEQLNALKQKIGDLQNEILELTDDELSEIFGGEQFFTSGHEYSGNFMNRTQNHNFINESYFKSNIK